eukprot:scaffold443340_cov43-Prasinocladus_malaysianus.AAC.1
MSAPVLVYARLKSLLFIAACLALEALMKMLHCQRGHIVCAFNQRVDSCRRPHWTHHSAHQPPCSQAACTSLSRDCQQRFSAQQSPV